jgi:Na+-transporting methylmalonyl-CoA/oxaloacetate decarboxylase gamma subunit
MNEILTGESTSAVTQSLILMAQGMAGIFVFMAVFYGLIEFLNRIFRDKATEDK